MADELDGKVKKLLDDMYGPPSDVKVRDRVNWIPFLEPKKFDDSTGTLEKYHLCLKANDQRLRNDKTRLHKEKETRKIFETQKQRYQVWRDRRNRHQSTYSHPFTEPAPLVGRDVMEHFNKLDQEELAKSLEAPLPEYVPAPPCNIEARVSPQLPSSISSPVPTDAPNPPNLSEAKKLDLALFGDDEEFEKSSKPSSSTVTAVAANTVEITLAPRSPQFLPSYQPAAPLLGEPFKSPQLQATTTKPHKHKKEKKEKKDKKEKKERKEKREKHHDHRVRDKERDQADREKEHRHKKHKHHHHGE